MNKRYLSGCIWTIAFCLSAAMMISSSFAAEAMNDEEMDRATAAGQPTVHKGNGNQNITDNSQFSVKIKESGQQETAAVSLVNVAGENNVAVAQNLVVVVGGGINQSNIIEQHQHARVEQKGTEITRSASDTNSVSGGGSVGILGVIDIRGEGSKSETETNTDIVKTAWETVEADHIKIGNGDQIAVDNTQFNVEIGDTAQQNLTAFSLINAAGRNNIAMGLNMAVAGFSLPADFDGVGNAGGVITQTNVIKNEN